MEARVKNGRRQPLGPRSHGGDPAAIEQHDAIREPARSPGVRAVEDGGSRPPPRHDRRKMALAGLGRRRVGLVEQEGARSWQMRQARLSPGACRGERRDSSRAPLEADDLECTTDRHAPRRRPEAVLRAKNRRFLRERWRRIHRVCSDEASARRAARGLGWQRMAADPVGRPASARARSRGSTASSTCRRRSDEEPDDLARVDRERDAPERHPAAVALDDAVDRDGRRARRQY